MIRPDSIVALRREVDRSVVESDAFTAAKGV